jgi:predicted nucleic acid-binding Zn finger protein
MTQFAPGRENGHDGRTDAEATTDTDLDARDVRALTECMSVLDEGGDVYTVVGENGGTYRVDAREGRCTCPDAQYNLPTDDGRERCKHEARVAYATGDRPVPAWVDTDAVDPQLGAGVDATPQVAATDGGADIIDAGDEGEVLDDEGDTDDGRPDDCECGAWNADADLPCWPCYREGFGEPATCPEK